RRWRPPPSRSRDRADADASHKRGRPMPPLIGASVRRVEDRRLLTGRGRYVGDLAVSGTLHAAFLRSPHPHALIRQIDVAAARPPPGVGGIFAVFHLEGQSRRIRGASLMAGYIPTDMPLMAMQKVRYCGEAIAVALAESRYAAEDAVECISVAYEPLEPVTDASRAATPGSPRVHD